MNILILDSWLREHLDTKAKSSEIAKYVSLCGPTFDKTTKVKVNGKTDYLYDVEVTTNRVDTMSVRGVAREAAVILPEFGIKSKLKPLKLKPFKPPVKSVPLNLKSNPTLTHRVMGVVLEVDSIGKSPKWLRDRLEASEIRSLNTAVDITNYIMTEVGHPTHVFDYDLVAPTMHLRQSKKGEKIESFDGKRYTLPGGDIVIDNGKGTIIDLPGIIGTKNSVVNKNTKRILFFLETNNPVKIRYTSMTLGIRTTAATLNEKGVDPELAEVALKRGIDLFKEFMNAKAISKIYDIYPKRTKITNVTLTHHLLESKLGISIKPNRVLRILKSLDFKTKFNKKILRYTVTPPSFRAKDITIPEDVVEEVARIYGYHNLPSNLMTGVIPDPLPNAPFEFEYKLKKDLKELGGNEVYTYSMVGKDMTDKNSLEIKNPLGSDSSHMRTTLMYSLINAAKENTREKTIFHLFEMANIYIPQKGKLPKERMKLAGVFYMTKYRKAKGIIEAFLKENIGQYQIKQVDAEEFETSHRIEFLVKGKTVGELGKIKGLSCFYYEFNMQLLTRHKCTVKSFKSIPKYPAQIEDITFDLPSKTKVIDVISSIKNARKQIVKVKLTDTYENSYTFRIWYQDEKKTLTDKEVSKIHSKITLAVVKQFGAREK